MSQRTKIEWATHTWNPVTGCTKVSQGCKNCYAERVVQRFGGQVHGFEPLPSYADAVTGRPCAPLPFSKVVCHPDRLDEPLCWRKPRRMFVCSMSDLFHEAVPDGFVWEVFNAFSGARGHTFMVLTKRPSRMAEFVASWLLNDPRRDLLPNLWLGVSVEDQATADQRIPLLLQTPAAVRFVSYEPALGPVDFTPWLGHDLTRSSDGILLPGISWLICGGESGPGARPMHPDWARSARDQCAAAGVPFFFKQWGEWRPGHPDLTPVRPAWRFEDFDGGRRGRVRVVRCGKKAAGRLLDGREWNEVPEVSYGA